MKRHLISSLVVSVLLLLIFYLVDASLPYRYLHTKFPVLVGFFFLQSLPIAWMLQKGEKDKTNFPMYVIGSIGLRLITSLFLLLIFYTLKIPDIIKFSIQFAGVYLVYLIFELTVVVSNLRRK